MQVELLNRQRKFPIDKPRLVTAGQDALGALGYGPEDEVDFSLLLVSDRKIAQLHKQYFDDPTPTNVISFPLADWEEGQRPAMPLGDIAVSVETAQRDAQEVGDPLHKEIAFLMIHGLLHLLGYDHVLPGKEGAARRKKMERLEKKVMKAAWEL